MSTIIIDSLNDCNVFFIFRENLTEVKLVRDSNGVIRSERYKLTMQEKHDISKIYKSKYICTKIVKQ